MANTFLKIEGYEVGDSLVEDEELDVARALLTNVPQRDPTLIAVVEKRTQQDAKPAIGVGDRAAAVDQAGAGKNISHDFTGGVPRSSFLKGGSYRALQE